MCRNRFFGFCSGNRKAGISWPLCTAVDSGFSLYYKVVVIRVPLQGLCYTVRDAVAWLSLEAWLKTTLKSSVAFMALSRAGYEPRRYFDREDFSHLFDFNTVEVISVLGTAASDISEMVIREMGETVREM